MESLKKLVNRRYVFHCTSRSGESVERDFEVLNTPGRALTSGYMPGWVPPSLRAIYREWNGLRLFEPHDGSHEGFRLFELDTCAVQLRQLREIFDSRRSGYHEDSSLDPVELDRWLDGLVPVAETMASGDLFALDTANSNAEGECPVYFLDHEYFFGGDCDPESMKIVAENLHYLLEDVLEHPLKFVAAHWIGGDPYDQWYPASCTITG